MSTAAKKTPMQRIDAKSLSQVAWQDLRARSMQVPCGKSSAKDRPQNLLDRFSVEAAVQDLFCSMSKWTILF